MAAAVASRERLSSSATWAAASSRFPDRNSSNHCSAARCGCGTTSKSLISLTITPLALHINKSHDSVSADIFVKMDAYKRQSRHNVPGPTWFQGKFGGAQPTLTATQVFTL